MNLHSLWAFLNSPFFLTMLTASVGGIVAAILSARWQRHSHLFQVRLETLQKVTELFSHWAEGVLEEDQKTRYKLVTKLVGGLQFLQAVFPSPEVKEATEALINLLLDDLVKGDEKQGKENPAGNNIGKQYQALLKLIVAKLGL